MAGTALGTQGFYKLNSSFWQVKILPSNECCFHRKSQHSIAARQTMIFCSLRPVGQRASPLSGMDSLGLIYCLGEEQEEGKGTSMGEACFP